MVYRQTTGGLAWVIDASSVVGASALERKAVAAYERRTAEVARLRCRGLAVVIPNDVVRRLFTTIRWLAAPGYAEQVFSARDEAERWARARLALGQLKA